MTGAEELLGNGDMLFYPVTFSAPLRVQGSFISGTEVAAVVNYIKDHFETDFNEDASKFVFGNGGSGGGGGGEASNTSRKRSRQNRSPPPSFSAGLRSVMRVRRV